MTATSSSPCWTRSPTHARSSCDGRCTWSADYDAWGDARDAAHEATGCGSRRRTPSPTRSYRAAEDREDAAQDTLAHTEMSRTSVS